LPVYDKIQSDISKLESDKKSIENILTQNNAKISVYNEELENNSDDKLNEEKQQEIDSIQSKITQCNEIIIKNKLDIDVCENSIINLARDKYDVQLQIKENESILSSLNEVNFDKEIQILTESKKGVDSIIVKQKTEKKKLNDSLDEFTQFLRETENTIKGAIKCPKCLHEFLVGSEEISIEEAKNIVPEIRENV
jgi:hypothetical protein